MRLALVALAFTLPAASSAEAPASSAPSARSGTAAGFVPSRICRDDMEPRTARSPEAMKPRRLGELPPGDLTLSVLNRVGDCIEPVIVRQGIGGFDGRPGR